MERMAWTTVDKSAWPEGPWKNEPDKEQWQDEATGMPCLLVRNRMGSLCGYVGVDDSHLWHGVGYDQCVDPGCAHEDYCGYEKAPEGKTEVHGGLTYSDLCMEGPEAETVCHVPAPGEPDPVWWFGFDTAHSGDLSPGEGVYDGVRFYPARLSGEYRTRGYVKAECANLAKQLASVPKQSLAEGPGARTDAA